MKQKLLSKIPAVNDLLDTDRVKNFINEFSRQVVLDGIRVVTDEIRNQE